MKKIGIFILLTSFLAFSAQGQGFKDILKKAKSTVSKGGLSQEDAGNGLKQALNIGVDEAVSFLSVKDGYYKSAYKVLLPKEVQSITNKLKVVPGFKSVEANMIEKINRAAEDAASAAKPIFVNAIKQMSFDDALNILTGDKDSATRFLEKSTYDQLYDAFKPQIVKSMEKVEATSYWNSAVTKYNKLPFTKDANPDLSDHVTKQALVGMFGLVEKKEAGIRGDKSLRTNDLLKKVFSQQDK
jgi:hypothetical protein